MIDVPEEFLPDDYAVIGEDFCPGCGDGVSVSHEYNVTEHKGEKWHRECFFKQDPTIEEADTRRVCLNCHGFSAWRKQQYHSEQRVCACCGWKFHGPTVDEWLNNRKEVNRDE